MFSFENGPMCFPDPSSSPSPPPSPAAARGPSASDQHSVYAFPTHMFPCGPLKSPVLSEEGQYFLLLTVLVLLPCVAREDGDEPNPESASFSRRLRQGKVDPPSGVSSPPDINNTFPSSARHLSPQEAGVRRLVGHHHF